MGGAQDNQDGITEGENFGQTGIQDTHLEPKMPQESWGGSTSFLLWQFETASQTGGYLELGIEG